MSGLCSAAYVMEYARGISDPTHAEAESVFMGYAAGKCGRSWNRWSEATRRGISSTVRRSRGCRGLRAWKMRCCAPRGTWCGALPPRRDYLAHSISAALRGYSIVT